MDELLLASSSPRRREILKSLGITFSSFAPDIDESLRDGLQPVQRVVALAIDKAMAAIEGSRSSDLRLVLGADTLVCVYEELAVKPDSDSGKADSLVESVLGKPSNKEEARTMLRLLAGRKHMVHTGLCLIERESYRRWTARSDSIVSFARMSEAEIEAYLGTSEWKGVAGAYRIQGRAAFHIDRIEGSWSGIVGLPIRELYGILREADFRLGPRA